jgi:Zn-dependent metalloprotease
MKKVLILLLAFAPLTALWAQYSGSQMQTMLLNHQPLLAKQDVEGLLITDQYTDWSTGITHVYLRQVVNGIEVFNGNAAFHINNEGKVVSYSSSFATSVYANMQSSKPAIGVAAALMSAGAETEMNVQSALSKADMPLVNNEAVIVDAAVSEEPIKTKLYYLVDAKGKLVLTYNVELFNNETNDWWNVRVDATSGTVLEKNNWTSHCLVANGMYGGETNVHSEKSILAATTEYGKTSGTGTYLVVPYPFESPIHGNRQYVSGSTARSNASPFGWHDTDGVVGVEYTVTKGNNVFADEDTLASNGNGFSPNGGDSLIFDFPLDSNWLDYNYFLPAAITNLFYANNYVHDVFYQYGFDEVSGNFQYNNYEKGGLQRDQVQAEAQDGSGTGNANFSTPADGGNGRMQMYLWPTGSATQPPINISSPANLAGDYSAPLSSFGAKRFGELTARVVLVEDSNLADSLGCGPLVNTAELAGNIALIYRGSCQLPGKVLNAQNAGAIAVIMINNTSATPSAMSGNNAAVVIPSVIVTQALGVRIKAALDNGDTVMATLKGLPVVKAFDSDFDNGVIAHEYGHGISNRLTGGPANSNCLSNAEQAGEGWSDFFALALTAKPGDSGTFARGIGTFVFNQATTDLGIRDFKYSTKMSVNPMTYNYLKNNKGVHYVGTVWCTMLWDMYWNLVDKYGFDEDIFAGTGGNNKAIQLVIDGLKLQPCSPGFVDARNAIIKADSIRYGGANRDLIWNTFARRGLGYTATQGSTNSVADGVAKFDLPPGVVGISDAENLARFIELSPNPTQGLVTIVMPDQLKEAQVTVFDIAGKVVFEQNMRTDAVQHIQLDIADKQRGMYFVKISNGGTVFQSKLLLTN